MQTRPLRDGGARGQPDPVCAQDGARAVRVDRRVRLRRGPRLRCRPRA